MWVLWDWQMCAVQIINWNLLLQKKKAKNTFFCFLLFVRDTGRDGSREILFNRILAEDTAPAAGGGMELGVGEGRRQKKDLSIAGSSASLLTNQAKYFSDLLVYTKHEVPHISLFFHFSQRFCFLFSSSLSLLLSFYLHVLLPLAFVFFSYLSSLKLTSILTLYLSLTAESREREREGENERWAQYLVQSKAERENQR